MAASIPVLRVLLRDVALTRNKYNRDGSTGKSSQDSRVLGTIQSQKTFVITYPEPIEVGTDWKRNPKRETVIYGTTTTIV